MTTLAARADRLLHRLARRAWLLPLVVGGILLAITLAVALRLQNNALENRQTAQSTEIALITVELRNRLRSHAQFLRGLRGAFANAPEKSPEQWQDDIRQLNVTRNFPGVDRFGFARRSDDGRSAEGAAYPVSHAAPTSDDASYGTNRNLYASARQRLAIDHSRDTDDVALSGRIALLAENGAHPGLMLALPVYRQGSSNQRVEERQQAIAGIVFATLRVNDLMESLNYLRNSQLGLRIYDDEGFNDNTEGSGLTLLHESVDQAAARHGAVEERDIEFGGRRWILHFQPVGDPPVAGESILAMGGGSIISLLLGLLAWNLISRKHRAEQDAHATHSRLSLSEERFQLATQATNDGIWDRMLDSGTIFVSERLEELLGFAPGTIPAEKHFFASRVHPQDLPRLKAATRKHIEEGAPYDIEFRLLRNDREWRWFRSRGQALRDTEGRAVRMVGSLTDITSSKEAERRLEHYKDFLSTVLKSIPHPVFVMNREGGYIMANRAMCEFSNRSEAELIAPTARASDNLPDETARLVRDMDEAVFSTGKTQIAEFELPVRERGLRTVIARKTLAIDPDGAAILIGTLTDVTERRQAERAILKTSRQLQSVLDAATEVSIIATDTDGLIKTFNRGAEKMLGYEASEMIDRQKASVIHLQNELEQRSNELSAFLGRPVEGLEIFTAMAKLHGAEHREWTYVRKDGSRLVVNLAVTAVHDEHGAIRGYLGIAVDISDRKQAENELLRQHHLLQTIIEHIPGGVSLIDSDLRVVASNKTLLSVLNFPEELFANGPPSLYELALFNARRGDYGPGDPIVQARAVIERARTAIPHCFERTQANGTTLEIRGTPLPDGGFVTIYTDVTERKAVEAELLRHRDRLSELVAEQTADLLQAKEAAESASRTKSEFLANMSHELRTPIHAMLGFARLGEEKSEAEHADKLLHFFHRIRQSADRLLTLINGLLDLSKLEAGKMHLDLKAQDTLPIIREALAELAPLLDKHRLTAVIAPPACSSIALCDAARFGQVVRNILANAIKFSPVGGQITLDFSPGELYAGRRANDKEKMAALRIRVADQGIGIPPDELVAVFDKFVQSSKTRSGAGGTGLGLSICREIMLAHHGSIEACNNPGGGATLILQLPSVAMPFLHAASRDNN